MLPPLLVRDVVEPAPLLELDPAQRRVVERSSPGICVVLGSPGTGATTAIVEAVARRSDEVPAARMLVVVRDRDAVRRMRSRLARRRPQGALPTITTFHGLAYSLVRRTRETGPDVTVPRLLSGAEEDARVRDLLRGAIADGDLPWPDALMEASATLGFANDLRAMLTRARELGLDPDTLARLGREAGVPAWEALGRLADIEADVMALEGVVDYSGLLELAIDAAPTWRGELDHIWVDDFQEAGVLQRHLLVALTGPRTSTVVMADPDIAAYGFRGGDRLGAMRLVKEAGARILVLDRYYSGGSALRAAYQAARRQPALPGVPAADLRAYREPTGAPHPVDGPDRMDDDSVQVLSHDTWGDLAAWLAQDLRLLRLREDIGWDGIAVIARSTAHLETLRRALAAAGVPVRIAATDIPLQHEPAVATLLAAVNAAIAPDALSDRDALALITGPLLALESAQVRRLARALREAHRAQYPEQACPAGMSLIRELLVSAIHGRDGAAGTAPPTRVALMGEIEAGSQAARDHVTALGQMIGDVRAHADRDRAPAEVLWHVWSHAVPDDEGRTWPERLRRAALGGHLASGHDLDAVIALFATAERLSERYAGAVGIRGLLAALSGQRVAAERVMASAPTTPAVSLMTPHMAVGRSWDHVVVAGAQEGIWPPALGSSSALRVHEWEALVAGDGSLGTAAVRAAVAERMAQERRLFALAVSRARVGLRIAVVSSDTEQPSRFVDDLDITPTHRPGRPPRPLTIDGMVARLRTVAQDPHAPSSLRQASIERLAMLADARDDEGVPLAPRAAPSTWWGLLAPSPGTSAVRPADRPVALSGSGLAGLQECPLRWFLSRVVRAEGPRGRALAVGSLVHTLAEHAAMGTMPIDAEAMLEQIDRVWSELPFDAPWESIAERAEVAAALERLCTYLRQADPSIAVEHDFAVTIPLREPVEADAPDAGGSVDAEVTVRGAIDRIEIDADGRVRLVDFKTMRTAPSARAVEEDPQLGMYQLAVLHGALDPLVPDPDLAGAALVQLRLDAKSGAGMPRIQPQRPLDVDASPWLTQSIRDSIARVRAEDFPAIVSSACRTCPYVVACPAQDEGREVLT